VQPDRLLSGERPDTPYLEDAHHWIKVYSELREFKAEVLRLAEERVRSMGRDSAAEVEETDLKVLRAEAERINRRLIPSLGGLAPAADSQIGLGVICGRPRLASVFSDALNGGLRSYVRPDCAELLVRWP